jgi:hypothetical protein
MPLENFDPLEEIKKEREQRYKAYRALSGAIKLSFECPDVEMYRRIADMANNECTSMAEIIRTLIWKALKDT